MERKWFSCSGRKRMGGKLLNSQQNPPNTPCKAGPYRIAFGPRAGQKVLTVQGAMPKEVGFNQTLCADISGFSLHAVVRCKVDDRQALEQLCRYITRPALANERVQSSRRSGATASRTWSCRRWSLCSDWRRWYPGHGCT